MEIEHINMNNVTDIKNSGYIFPLKIEVIGIYGRMYILGTLSDLGGYISMFSKKLNKFTEINRFKGKFGMRITPTIWYREKNIWRNRVNLYKGFINGIERIPSQSWSFRSEEVYFKTHEIIYEKFLEIKKIDPDICSVEVISDKKEYVPEYLCMFTFIEVLKKSTEELEKMPIMSNKAIVKFNLKDKERIVELLKNVKKNKNLDVK